MKKFLFIILVLFSIKSYSQIEYRKLTENCWELIPPNKYKSVKCDSSKINQHRYFENGKRYSGISVGASILRSKRVYRKWELDTINNLLIIKPKEVYQKKYNAINKIEKLNSEKMILKLIGRNLQDY